MSRADPLRPLVRGGIGLLVAFWALLGACAASAQGVPLTDIEPPAETVEPAQADTMDETAVDPPAGDDAETGLVAQARLFPDWPDEARVAIDLISRNTASPAALERVRADLVAWRDAFMEAQSVNAGRIATVRAQLDALGLAGGESEPPAAVAARRAELEGQLDELLAPVLLAREGFALADGLIREIDAIVRSRQAAQLLQRGPSPLNPDTWVAGIAALMTQLDTLRLEIGAGLQPRSEAPRSLQAAMLFAGLGVILILFGRRLARMLKEQVHADTRRGRGAWDFLVSAVEALLLLGGIVMVMTAVLRLGVLGPQGQSLVALLRPAAALVIAARWLSNRVFPAKEGQRTAIELDEETRRRGRVLSTGLGWTFAASTVLSGMFLRAAAEFGATIALLFPVQLVEAWLLWRLGGLLVRAAQTTNGDEDEQAPRSRGTRLAGRLAMLGAVAGPLLAAAGYPTAAQGVLLPTVLTLAILGTVRVLQSVVYDLYTLLTGDRDGGAYALAPVLIGFALLFCALPVLALAWGAQVSDLTELWARFRTGLSIGQTTISPTDFLTFAAVFGALYFGTRLLQGALRSTVLPRTKLDIGGQNAIAAGTGYIGIFLAAVIAISAAGIDLSSLAIVAGALSVGIGFGLQNIVSNFVSGIILLIERPISQGDWIEVNGQMGFVRDISVRSTRIETFDRTDVIVPNADLVSGQVTNWTRGNLIGRVIVPVGVSYRSDPDEVMAILQDIANSHPALLAIPEPYVLFRRFGADALEFEIRGILRDVNYVLNVQSEMNFEIVRRFTEAGIEIPFAQRDIWLRNAEVLRPGGAQASDMGPSPAPDTRPDTGPATRA